MEGIRLKVQLLFRTSAASKTSCKRIASFSEKSFRWGAEILPPSGFDSSIGFPTT